MIILLPSQNFGGLSEVDKSIALKCADFDRCGMPGANISWRKFMVAMLNHTGYWPDLFFFM